MNQRNPYEVLGVSAGASSNDIRAAFIKRAKVLDPDRYDKATQPTEWQMANEMLEELDDAYAQVRSSDQQENGNSEATATDQELPPTHANTSEIDLLKTKSYVTDATNLWARSQNLPIVPLDKDNYDQHLADLNRYITVNFEVQQALAGLDAANVDPLAIELVNYIKNNIQQYSRFITERVALVSHGRNYRINIHRLGSYSG